MKLSARDILAITHLRAVDFGTGKSLMVTGVSIDTRILRRGDLFFAIKGTTYDGHNFLTKAIEAGASAAILENRWVQLNEAFLLSLPIPYLVVEDSTRALGELAAWYRRKFRIPVLAIGGSNGKTTTKEMIRRVLETKYSVLATEGNLNNHIGVPLTIFRLEKKHQVAVIEVGTNHRGEIDYLCGVLEPTHGLITNIGQEHLEFFNTVSGVAKAEGELFDWIATHRSGNGWLFLNSDDRHLAKRRKKLRNIVNYGFKIPNAVFRGSAISTESNGNTRFRVKPRGKSPIEITLSVPGIHNAYNALAATAVGLTLKVPAAKIQRALLSFAPTGKRMEVLSIDGVTVLNDTYNSNPESVIAALQTLKSIRTPGKKIAVLADMLELGLASEALHKSVARQVESSKVEYLLTYGPLSRHTSEAASVKFKVHYDQKNMLSEYLIELLTPGDVVLIKGSRGMKMEDVVTFIQERLSKAA
ncbi:MAG: UDP-N-acetylmuramoyl-tripeptide--D-alanyl-D-alanine ligase [Ignavibacteriales bacterium]|nr:UDP-N-acetylmuramoyl-tripeptide--D-alanyl-D-alanine ligase [Ignavibacteriales bacterium]